jgi:hypothetical protein
MPRRGIQGDIKILIVNFHKEYSARLRKALDIEKWSPVPP